ncbi:MAG TPA: RNA methyltransferase [Verrucomicrobiota bacterium]|nr:RNA methyltransferase [Verrucomicrobiota bacterium]HOP97930.1 RNA methyltransferase [Verrucomicrobiota bacterium]
MSCCIHRIESLDLPELAPYRTMRRTAEHREQGIFVAEGEKVVRRLLESSFPVVSVLLPEKWVAAYEPLIRARPEPMIPVYVVTRKDVLEKLTGFSMYQGILAVGRIPPQPSLEELLATSARPRLFVAVDGLTNAENLGALVRNCVAFGAQALVVGETCSSPFLRRAVRNSMGTIFQLPVVESPLLLESLTRLRAAGVRCIAAHPHAEQRALSQANLTTDCCLVFGSEGEGISPPVLRLCEEKVAIPMAPGVDSLNVGAAAAVFLYEVHRQRAAASARPEPPSERPALDRSLAG